MTRDEIIELLKHHQARAQAASEHDLALDPHALVGEIELRLLKTIMKEIDDGSEGYVLYPERARSEVSR